VSQHRHIMFVLIARRAVHALTDYGKVDPQLFGALHTAFSNDVKLIPQ